MRELLYNKLSSIEGLTSEQRTLITDLICSVVLEDRRTMIAAIAEGHRVSKLPVTEEQKQHNESVDTTLEWVISILTEDFT